MKRFLWLDGIFDEATVHSYPSISVASNFWQKGFVMALQNAGCLVDIIGYPVERMWPLGRLVISSNQAHILPGFNGAAVGYINLPYIREYFQYVAMLRSVRRHLKATQNCPDYLVVFSCLVPSAKETAAIRVAKNIQKVFGIPWLCIVADGAVPEGADGYIFLPWSQYQASYSVMPSIHIDGGIPEIKLSVEQVNNTKKQSRNRALMYMGELTEHGGALELAKAFRLVQGDRLELWICGRGLNPKLDKVAASDSRIKLKGFVTESELNDLGSSAFAFANPRPEKNFAPNRLNFPSKLLHYLAFGKPVISTFTEGLSPDYAEIIVPIKDESIESIAESISDVLNMSKQEYTDMEMSVSQFCIEHSWTHQVGRLISWLEERTSQKIKKRVF